MCNRAERSGPRPDCFAVLFHLIVTEHLKLVRPFATSLFQDWVSFVYIEWTMKGNAWHVHLTTLESSQACILVCLCHYLSCYVLFFCLPVCLSMCLDTIHHLIQLDPALVWREVARAEYTNCFLAVRDKLLASPFKLHFRVWLPYSTKQCQWCQISGSKAKIKC